MSFRTTQPLLRGAIVLEQLLAGRRVTAAWLRQRFKLSPAQSKRDMRDLQNLGRNVRNIGGRKGETTLIWRGGV